MKDKKKRLSILWGGINHICNNLPINKNRNILQYTFVKKIVNN